MRANSPCQYVSKALISTYENLISHWPIPNVQPPSHSQSLYGNPKWQCGRVGEHQMLCGDWLVCQTISVCNHPITCTARFLARAYVCSHVIRTAILNWDRLGNGRKVVFACPLNPHFAHSATHCVGWVTWIYVRPLAPVPYCRLSRTRGFKWQYNLMFGPLIAVNYVNSRYGMSFSSNIWNITHIEVINVRVILPQTLDYVIFFSITVPHLCHIL